MSEGFLSTESLLQESTVHNSGSKRAKGHALYMATVFQITFPLQLDLPVIEENEFPFTVAVAQVK